MSGDGDVAYPFKSVPDAKNAIWGRCATLGEAGSSKDEEVSQIVKKSFISGLYPWMRDYHRRRLRLDTPETLESVPKRSLKSGWQKNSTSLGRVLLS